MMQPTVGATNAAPTRVGVDNVDYFKLGIPFIAPLPGIRWNPVA